MGLHNHNHQHALELDLGLSLNTSSQEETITTSPSSNNKVIIHHDEPSLTLGTINYINKIGYSEENHHHHHHVGDSPHSVVSSLSSGGRVVMKRERDLSSEEVEITERISSRVSDDEDGGTTTRKKLRLTKDQSALLEDSFKQHSTLNPKQKQALARQLNLRPRQVEVWFQNRRARTKLKQTEVDCEFLKKCCETLTDENRRLQKEVQELKALKFPHQPLYMPMPAATLTMCPSCERLSGVSGVSASNKTPFSSSLGPKSHHHFFNPFTNPSPAC